MNIGKTAFYTQERDAFLNENQSGENRAVVRRSTF